MNMRTLILLLVGYWGNANAQKPRGYPCLVLGAGVKASYVLPSNIWTPDDSYGFRQGMGLGTQAEYRFNTRQSVVIRATYQRWGVQRQYFDGAGVMYQQASTRLSVVPVSIGYKHRLSELIYLMPDAGVAFQHGIQTDTLSRSVTNKQTTWGFGLSLGLEKPLNRYRYDLSLRYGYLSSAFGVSTAWQYLSVGLAVGWQTRALRNAATKCYYY